MPMTQAQKVAEYLDSHLYIDRYIAMNHLYIANITAVIADMRQQGYDIITEEHKSSTGAKYARWRKGALWQSAGCLPKQSS